MTLNGCLCFDLTLIISHDTVLFIQVTGVYGETNKVSIHALDKLHVVSNVQKIMPKFHTYLNAEHTLD